MRTDQIAIYVDPPSHHFLGDALFASQGNVFAGDQILAPYVALRDYFAGQGIPVRTIDYLPAEIDEVRKVYVSFGMRERAAKLAARADVIASAFFAMECPVVEPSLYRALPTLQPLFRRIYSWSDTASLLPFTHAPVELEHFSWPQSFDRVHEPLWQRGERKFLMMMNSNKLPVLYTRELYTRRVAAVAYFEQFGEIDLYGKGWDGPPFRMNYGVLPGTVQKLLRRGEALWRRYVPDPQLAAARRAWQGTARHKSETLSHYTFALCFENSILTGWITEKMFDCFFAGTIPVYWGAPEIAERVPRECFIDMRDFADFAELRAFLKGLGPRDIAAYREHARDYLGSPAFDPFRKAAFVDIFRRIVEEDCGVDLAA